MKNNASDRLPVRKVADVELLRVFDTLIRVGSFTAAASMLSRTQSAVSMQMKRLEEQLGVELVKRSTRKLVLTQDGQQLLPIARQMLGLNDQLFKEAETQEISGSIRIGAIEHYATRVLPQLVAEFCRIHPRVHVELLHGVSSQMRSELGARFDLVIGIGHVGSSEGSPLLRSRVVFASSAKLSPHLQRPLPLAVHPEGTILREWATQSLDRAGISWRIAYSSTTNTGLEAAVRAGLAVGVFRDATISKRLRILGSKEGLPSIPSCEAWLATVPNPDRKAVVLLEAFLLHKLVRARA